MYFKLCKLKKSCSFQTTLPLVVVCLIVNYQQRKVTYKNFGGHASVKYTVKATTPETKK